MSWPSIDHSTLSPSGRVSKRSRKAALKRAHDLLWPNGFPKPTYTPTSEERKQHLLSRAKFLEGLADGGMRPRVHRKLAAQLRAEADAL